jgi:hypothetical protein
LHGIGLGGDEREDGGAVWRRYGDQAFAGLELDVVGEVEAELVEVEAEAAVKIADEDCVEWMRRWGEGGCEGDEGPEDMDEIIRRGAGGKKRITQRRRVRRSAQRKRREEQITGVLSFLFAPEWPGLFFGWN